MYFGYDMNSEYKKIDVSLMRFNYRVPLLTSAELRRNDLSHSFCSSSLKSFSGREGMSLRRLMLRNRCNLGRTPPQKNSTACTGMPRMDKWPTPESPLAWTGQ